MDKGTLLALQSERGTKTKSNDVIAKDYDKVVEDCRREIQDRANEYRNLSNENKIHIIQNIIKDFVIKQNPLVKGYIKSDNTSDLTKLQNDLIGEITDYGILAGAMADPEVNEIRSNGREIKIEKKGRIVDLTDGRGRVVRFNSEKEQTILMRKFLGDVRLTPKDALVSARTVEGYRIAATHSSVMGLDPSDPQGERYHSFVLRKLKKDKLILEDLVRFGTMSDRMAQLLEVIIGGGQTAVTCGPTASGKTTTNNAALKSAPLDLRLFLAQNPSEIDARLKDATGRVINDVVHLEAIERENPTPTTPTMANIMVHSLRFSPNWVILGEIRSNEEFAVAMMIAGAGHPFNATYHAFDSHGAFWRFVTAYKAHSGEDTETAVRNVADKLKFIVIQRILRDGSRRVLQISEILGVDPDNEKKPIINDIFRFKVTNKEFDESGRVTKINGYHEQVGTLSQQMIENLDLEGVQTEKYMEFAKLNKEPETYKGDWLYKIERQE